jgi:nitrite reductase/ring-hydroxylating ferredoxin subunit
MIVAAEQMMKCDMCYDRTSAGLRPMCATVCPSQALAYVPRETIARERREVPSNVFWFGNQRVTTRCSTWCPRGAREVRVDVVDYMWEEPREREPARAAVEEEVSPFAADERYVSGGSSPSSSSSPASACWPATCGSWPRAALRRAPARRRRRPGGALSELPVGGARLFEYPAGNSLPAGALRRDRVGAYGQRCTHLSCPVFWRADERRLVCPCHHGAFAVEDGRVLQGPPPRPLPRVQLERRGDLLVAVGIEQHGEQAT